MKNLPGTIKLALLPVVAITLVLALRTVMAGKDGPNIQAPFVLKVDSTRQLKNDDGGKAFEKVLSQKSHIYCMHYHKKDDSPANDKHWKKNCPDATSTSSAESAKAGEYTLICSGAHVTQRAGFMTQADMDAVESLLQ